MRFVHMLRVGQKEKTNCALTSSMALIYYNMSLLSDLDEQLTRIILLKYYSYII